MHVGRSVVVPTSDEDGVLKVLVYHDMEGLSGQSDWRTYLYYQRDRYEAGRALLTADMNAVIDGLFAGGADSVDVVDAHGSGNPDPDVLQDQLDPRANMVFRRQAFRPYVDLVEPGAYDAVVAVGMHAKAGSRGFASHTYGAGADFVLNGRSVTETELIAYSWGRVGVPVLFASGDNKLADDLATMPWIETVVVKQAVSASEAELRPVMEVHQQLRRVARRALENRSAARAVTLTAPITAALRVRPPLDVSFLDGVPGIDYADGTVTFGSADFDAAYDGLVALVDVANAGAAARLGLEILRAQPNAEHLMQLYQDTFFQRWLDVESGRWSARPNTPQHRERYHGVN